MSWNEGLVDLSLFAHSPTNDRAFTIAEDPTMRNVYESAGNHTEEHAHLTREFYAPVAPVAPATATPNVGEHYAWKPLPPLPPRTICGAISIPRDPNGEPQCILTRIKRKRTNEAPAYQENNLLRRRNLTSPPRLTLSAPAPTSNAPEPASEMVWMPEEQMWLIVGGRERVDRDDLPGPSTGPIRYHTPPSNSPRTNFSQSAPTTRAPSMGHDTPPVSPVQPTLQTPTEPRDEERLSPLFQEAMNSVPMFDMFDSPPPPTYENTVRDRPLRSAPLRPAPPEISLTTISSSPVSPQSPVLLTSPRPTLTRTASTGSNYTTAPSHRSSSHRTSSSDSGSTLSRSQTQNKDGTRLPTSSQREAWSPNFSTPSRRAAHYRVDIGAGSSDQPVGRETAQQEMPGSARSWHGFARKLARP